MHVQSLELLATFKTFYLILTIRKKRSNSSLLSLTWYEIQAAPTVFSWQIFLRLVITCRLSSKEFFQLLALGYYRTLLVQRLQRNTTGIVHRDMLVVNCLYFGWFMFRKNDRYTALLNFGERIEGSL